jgi:hypothetical protein
LRGSGVPTTDRLAPVRRKTAGANGPSRAGRRARHVKTTSGGAPGQPSSRPWPDQRRSGIVRTPAAPDSAARPECAEGEKNLTRGARPGLGGGCEDTGQAGSKASGRAGDAGRKGPCACGASEAAHARGLPGAEAQRQADRAADIPNRAPAQGRKKNRRGRDGSHRRRPAQTERARPKPTRPQRRWSFGPTRRRTARARGRGGQQWPSAQPATYVNL